MSTFRRALLVLVAVTMATAALAGGPFTFSSIGNLSAARYLHNAVLLNNGKLLVVGGVDSTGQNYTKTAELFDPATGAWSATGSLIKERAGATATLLLDGKVLVAGGGANGLLASAELYDPITGTWSATGSMSKAREFHTAVLLPAGKVLVAGGVDVTASIASAELYDPGTGTWSNTNSLTTSRNGHTATLLPNGKVLVAAGYGGSPAAYLRSSELYDPMSGTWSVAGLMGAPRANHSATLLPNGKVLVAGGHDSAQAVGTAELYDPGSGSWTLTGSPVVPRVSHSATLLPNGKVLFAGGYSGVDSTITADLYDPANGQWIATSSMTEARAHHTATLLANGQVLIAAGVAKNVVATAELYNPALAIWSAGGSLVASRFSHTATILTDGRVLLAGGADQFGTARPLTEIYNPATNTCTLAGNLGTARQFHTATLLANGKVLVAGGIGIAGTPITKSELFDPAAGTWSPTGDLGAPRDLHTATLLPNGKVYVAGGETVGGGLLFSAELYDPGTEKWTATGNMINARRSHAATLLPNGKVLLVQGFNTGSFELYDPSTGTCTNLFTLSLAIYDQTATLLPNGKVVIAGGQANNGPQRSAFVYDPATGNLFAGNQLAVGRHHHTATLLPNGQLLVAGGIGSNGALSSAELFDPSSSSFPGTWSTTANLATEHGFHTATLLLNGKVLLAGGRDANGNSLLNTELYDVGLKFNAAWQPQITSSPAIANRSAKLTVGGVRFQGVSQASSGGYEDSSSNYPIVQLRNIDNSQVSYFLVDPTSGWSDTSTVTLPLTSGVPLGPSLVTIFTNGIPSAAKYLLVSPKSTQALNIATRLRVQQNDNILIGGFIVTGTAPKKVIMRGIGPSLNINGVPFSGRLANPFLELHDQNGLTVETNDNWKINDQTGQSQQATVEATGLPPADDLESAIVRTLTPSPYTAVLRGVNNSTGIGVVEVYDLDQAADSEMANISTRGFVETGDNVMIGGFILGNSGQGSNILVRGIGPSLTSVGISNALANPTLELHDGNGVLLGSNDNWKLNDQSQQSQENRIRATMLMPSDDLESAILTTLPPGNYTAILSGKNNGVGVAVVEIYNLH